MAKTTPTPTRGPGFDETTTVPPPAGMKHILGIGINKYKGSGWSPLGNAVRDMEKVVALLQERYDFDEATLLRDDDATREGIEEALYRFTDPTVIGENDSLLIYYSGHGHLDRTNQGYWVPINAIINKISTYLPNSRIREIIAGIQSRHVLLISDSCFSGSFFTRGGNNASLAVREYENRKSRWAFCSGRHDEEVSDGGAGGHSPFATAIIEELRANEAAKINVARLAINITETTRANYPQMPEASPIFGVGDAGGQFVFTLRNGGTEQTPIENPVPDPITPVRAQQPEPEPQPAKAQGMSPETITALKSELRTLISKNRSEQAMQQLITLSETQFPDLADEITSLSSRWEEMKRQERMGILGYSEVSMERNKINSAILGMISSGLQ